MDDDLISRAAAFDSVEIFLKQTDAPEVYPGLIPALARVINNVPSAQPEPAIPLQWIEARIEWLKSLDNAFSTLTAVQISAMVNKWKDEHDG